MDFNYGSSHSYGFGEGDDDDDDDDDLEVIELFGGPQDGLLLPCHRDAIGLLIPISGLTVEDVATLCQTTDAENSASFYRYRKTEQRLSADGEYIRTVAVFEGRGQG